MMKIDSFRGEYRWLSNFYPVVIEIDGNLYPSVEHAYMSMKSDDFGWKMFCMNDKNTAGDVKRKSREITLIEDWDQIKLDVMWQCLVQKYEQSPLREMLLETGYAEIIEGNWWGDTFWGFCNKLQMGNNYLGKMIMSIRSDLNENNIINTFNKQNGE